MAVVRNYYSPEGCNIIVHDDYYRDITPEENKARLDRATQIVLQAEFSRYIESLKRGTDSPELEEKKDIGLARGYQVQIDANI